MIRRRLVSMVLALLLMVSTVFGLSEPVIQIGKDKQSLKVTGQAAPDADVNIIVQENGKRYYLDTTKADKNGNYTFKTKLPKDKIFEGILSSDGERVVVEISTIEATKPPTEKQYVTFSVDKKTIDKGYVVSPMRVEFIPGETVWDVFQRELDNKGIDYEYSFSGVYNSVYVESIDGDGEFDHGQGSGWMYNVNGRYPDYGPTLYELQQGDRIEWRYTTNYGADLGDETSGARPPAGGIINGQILIPNRAYASITVPEGDESLSIVLDDTHFLLQQLNIQVPKSANKAVLNLENAIAKLPEIKVVKEDMQLIIPKDNKIIGDNKLIPLFSEVEAAEALKNATMYQFTLEDKPVLFDQENTITIKDGASQSIAWYVKDKRIEIPTYKSKQEATAHEQLEKGIGVGKTENKYSQGYAYKSGKDLVLVSKVLQDLMIYEAEEIKEITYKDLDKISKWAQEEVMQATEFGLVGGYEDGTFRPHNQVTRAEFVSILVRTLYGTELEAIAATNFTDISETDWYKSAIDVAYEQGIINGYGDTFKPNDTITREQMAVMLARALGLVSTTEVVDISDKGEISEWAQDDVFATYEAGIIKGIDGAFKPQDQVTREMSAVIAVRLYDWLKSEAKTLELSAAVGNPFTVGGSQSQLTSFPVLEKPVPTEVKRVLDATTKYMTKMVVMPQYGSIGGEWAVFGLARRGAEVPKDYYDKYYKHIEEVVKVEDSKMSRAWKTKVTEVQRVALAVAAIGKDPTNVAGIDLIDYSFNKAKHMKGLPEAHQILGGRQGLNELVFGLIAMDLKQTPTPVDAQITREEIIETIIQDYQTVDGGFNLKKGSNHGEVDITGMAVQALSPYYGEEGGELVKSSVDNALEYLSIRMKGSVVGEVDPFTGKAPSVLDSSESITQTVVALCSLGINPTEDERFIKDGRTLIDYLLDHYIEGRGFEHVIGQGVNQMATEQAYYALVAYERLLLGKSSIYDMTDVK